MCLISFVLRFGSHDGSDSFLKEGKELVGFVTSIFLLLFGEAADW